ncbi:MAG: hypothetical protein IPK08_19665 [Bacteroidetes bacterium]|nr:hypothetical protein [Bacteroidota bacterium]
MFKQDILAIYNSDDILSIPSNYLSILQLINATVRLVNENGNVLYAMIFIYLILLMINILPIFVKYTNQQSISNLQLDFGNQREMDKVKYLKEKQTYSQQ